VSSIEIVLLGSGGHAKVVLDIVKRMNRYKIIGVVSKDSKTRFCDLPILGNDNILPDLFNDGIRNVVMGIGGYRDNLLRKEVFLKVKNMGFNFISAIDPSAVISDSAIIGEGVVIFSGVVINSETILGDNVIIATGTTIDHETKIEDHVLVSAGVTIGANVIICEGSLLALGSNVISGITLGKNVILGAGATVVKNINRPGVYIGIPAKEMK